MKKQLLLRGLLGFPIGIALGYLITILVSLGWGGGAYAPCVPALADAVGSEIGAVMLQALLCGLLGAGFAACSLVWQVESWSLVKQTGVYFGIASLLMLPIAYAAYWMEHSLIGFVSYFAIFAFVFAAIWISQFALGRRSVRKMNEKLRSVGERGSDADAGEPAFQHRSSKKK